MTALNYFLALFCLCLVAFSWYQAQQAKRTKQTPKRVIFFSISLALIAASFSLWNQSQGTEFATFFVLFHLSWLSWFFIFLKARPNNKPQREKFVNKVSPEKNWWYKSGVILLAGPVALTASILTSLIIARVTTEQLSNQWVLCFMLVPLVWGGLAFWIAADNKLLRPVLATLFLTTISLLGIL